MNFYVLKERDLAVGGDAMAERCALFRRRRILRTPCVKRRPHRTCQASFVPLCLSRQRYHNIRTWHGCHDFPSNSSLHTVRDVPATIFRFNSGATTVCYWTSYLFTLSDNILSHVDGKPTKNVRVLLFRSVLLPQ